MRWFLLLILAATLVRYEIEPVRSTPKPNQVFVEYGQGRAGPHYEPAVEDGPVHNGREIMIDLPIAQQIRNFGAPVDKKGLCVFASGTMAARWHNERKLFDMISTLKFGAGWPEKVDQTIKKLSPESSVVHYLGSDPAFLDREIKNGHMLAVTYGYSERYRNNLGTIYHMVNLVYLDSEMACVLDNNFPCTVETRNGVKVATYRYEWMTRAEFIRRWVHPNGQGWAFSFTSPGPPPVLHNRNYRGPK